MAEYSPPTDNVPIFDVTNFVTTGSGLTEAQIASKFLRFPTGQGTETLPSLITGTITAPGSMDIIVPNTSSANKLNIGIATRNQSGQTHHYSDGNNCVSGTSVHLNNGNNNASSTNIMNGTTTTGNVNIMTGASSTGTTTIGTTGTTVAINGATTITGNTTIAGTASINSSNGLNTTIGTVTTGTTSIRGATISLTNVNTVNIGTSPPPDNTRAINIGGVNGAFTSLISTFGRLTTVGTTNINASGTNNTTIGNSGSTTAILGPTNINTSGSSTTTIGNDTGGITTLSSDTINIGNADTVTTMNGTNIKQVIKAVSGDLIENIIGNTTVASSMSTTFNRKFSSPVGGAIACYTITANSSDQFTNQYFEIYVSGANGNRGGYTYKGCFGVEKIGGGAITQTSVNTLFYHGTGVSPPTSTVIPVITFSLSGQILTLSVNTSGGGSSTQSFITTLSSFPTCSINSVGSPALEDFIITAI
jgi:hypothetical protein